MGTKYEIREAQTVASKAKLSEMVEAGIKLGYWSQVSVSDHHSKYVTVASPQGLHFDLSTGGWGNENTITASVARRVTDGGELAVYPRDVCRYGQANPAASAAATRDAETLAKTLNKRLVALPEATALAQLVADTLARKVSDREALRTHIALLEGLGYGFEESQKLQTYKAAGYRRGGACGPSKIEVTSSGAMYFSVDTSIERFAGIAAAMGTSD